MKTDTWQYTPDQGTSGAIGQGYGVGPDYSNLPSEVKTSGWMKDSDTDESVHLFVYDVTTTVAIGGSTAQSREKRSWYPRSLIQPSYTVACQARSNEELSFVAEFVRQQQLKWVRASTTQKSPDKLLTQLYIGATPLTYHTLHVRTPVATDTNSKDPTKTSSTAIVNPIVNQTRGPHREIWVSGYIKSVNRRAAIGEFAPEFSFEFIVAHDYTEDGGPFPAEQRVSASDLPKWSDVFLQGGQWVTDPEADGGPLASKHGGLKKTDTGQTLPNYGAGTGANPGNSWDPGVSDPFG